ncbi:hypothetical protein [Dechloromonas sp. H13]|nr:hypothetical protein [Dechloromonas sp. H13]
MFDLHIDNRNRLPWRLADACGGARRMLRSTPFSGAFPVFPKRLG